MSSLHLSIMKELGIFLSSWNIIQKVEYNLTKTNKILNRAVITTCSIEPYENEKDYDFFNSDKLIEQFLFNPFVPDASFLYPLKTLENLMVFWCFQGVKKRYTGNIWINIYPKFRRTNNTVKMKCSSSIINIQKLFKNYDGLLRSI